MNSDDLRYYNNNVRNIAERCCQFDFGLSRHT